MSNTEATFADPERIALIESIAAKISSFMEANADAIFRTTWACMWLADKECLRELSARANPDPFETLKTVEERRNVQTWTRAATKKDRKIRRALEHQCHERDPVSAITNITHDLSNLSHIYPLSTKDTALVEIEQFWQALRTFWTPERLDKWWQAIYEDGHGGPEKLQNLLCLDPNTHMLHKLGWFGLEPLNAALDGSWMNVQFWWLRPGERDASVEFTTPPQLPQILDPTVYRVCIYDARSSRLVCSGDVVTLVTQNPETHPLADMQIVEMRWVMDRVVAVSGLAEREGIY